VGRFDSSLAVIHENVSVLSCDSSATMAETLRLLADLDLPTMAIGDTALAFPADRFHQVQLALHTRACYPKVVGEPPAKPAADLEDEE
jgi:hypothetical protein